MIKNRVIYTLLLLLAFAFEAKAQYGTNGQNSPYTRYGFGQLSDHAMSANKAMGGIGVGLRNRTQINAINPASYSAVDSMTFLFDGGITLKNTNFDENGIKKNIKNSSFDYLAMQFRLFPRVGVTLGFLPFSSIGYNFSTTETLTNAGDYENVTSTQNYYGDGGLNQAFLGLGFGFSRNFSMGVNMSYLFGNITQSAQNTYDVSSASANYRYYMADISTYKLDLGAQYTAFIGKKSELTFGVTYSLGHNISSSAEVIDQKIGVSGTTTTIESADTVTYKNAFQLPHSFGVGFTYVYDKKLTIGFDYTLQKYGSVKFFGENDQLCNRSKFAFGAEYIPDYTGRGYLKRVHYRIGAYYSDPYAKVDGKSGAKEYGITAGFSLPIKRSLLNITGQYVKISPKTSGLLKQDMLGISVGFTFNEEWFRKWKMN